MSTNCDKCGVANPADIHTCGAGAVQTVQEPTIAACIIGADAVGKKIDGYEAAKVYAAMQKAMGTPPAAPCIWTKSADPNMPDTFDATCGVVWTFTDGGPVENDLRFCPGCGAAVSVAAPEPEEDLFDLAVKADNGGQP